MDFIWGYIIGSAECNNDTSDEYNGGIMGVFLVIAVFITLVPILGILGFEIGILFNDIKLVKFGFAIAFIYLFTTKIGQFITIPYWYVEQHFRTQFIFKFLYLLLLLFAGYIVFKSIEFVFDNSLARSFIQVYESLFLSLKGWSLSS